MNKYDLKQILEKERIDPRIYSIYGITGPPKDQQYVLWKEGLIWSVYFYERGHKFDLEQFLTEDEGCKRLLDLLLTDSTPRITEHSS